MILHAPVITEKSLMLASLGQYTFEVDPRANTAEIGKAIAAHFKVTVTNVRVISIPGSTRNFRFRPGKTTATKKAIATLKKGDKIPGFAYEAKSGGPDHAGHNHEAEKKDKKLTGSNSEKAETKKPAGKDK